MGCLGEEFGSDVDREGRCGSSLLESERYRSYIVQELNRTASWSGCCIRQECKQNNGASDRNSLHDIKFQKRLLSAYEFEKVLTISCMPSSL